MVIDQVPFAIVAIAYSSAFMLGPSYFKPSFEVVVGIAGIMVVALAFELGPVHRSCPFFLKEFLK